MSKIDRLEIYRVASRRAQKRRNEVLTLSERVTSLECAVGLDEDPSTRQAKRSKVTSTCSTLGWWGGAIGLSEALKGASGLTLNHIIDGYYINAINNLSWVVGVLVAADPVQRLGNNIGLKIALILQGRNNIPHS